MTTHPEHPPHQRASAIAVIWRLAAFAALALLAHGVGFVLAFPVAMASRQLGEIAAIAFSAFGVLAASGLLSRKLDGQPLRATGIGFDRPWFRQLALGFVVGAGLIAVAWLAFRWFGWATVQTRSIGSVQVLLLFVAAMFCLVTAVHEETIFRGYAFQVLYRRNPAVALALGGLLFAGTHVFNTGGTEPLALANLFVAHVLFAAAYLRTRSLWLPIGIHIGWNFVEAFVLGMPISGRVPAGLVLTTTIDANLWTGGQFGPEGGLLVTVILVLAAALVWAGVRQRFPAVDLLASPEALPSGGPALQPALAAPTAPSQRVLATDVLRGIAILGILPMNMQVFGMYPATVIYPYAGEFTDSTNIAAWILLRIFIGSKDLLLFGMLFGAGILMVDGGQRARGGSGAALHYRRMAVVLVFGLAHAYLIWAGDILVTYAMCGSIVYLLRGLPSRVMALLGALAFAVPMALLLTAHFVLPHVSIDIQDKVAAFLQPDAERMADFKLLYAGNWLAETRQRITDAIVNQTISVALCMGWISGGMMLLGMGMQKSGVLTAKASSRSYAMMVAAALAVGFPLLIFSFAWNSARQWRLPDGFFLGWCLRETSYAIIAMGWIGGVMLVCRYGKLARGSAALGAVGRMALTNYLLQSIVCSLLFHGHGLGLVGRVDHVGQILMTLAIWVGQLALSPIWLAHFRFGPAEWLWRSLSYGEWQPMRCQPAARFRRASAT